MKKPRPETPPEPRLPFYAALVLLLIWWGWVLAHHPRPELSSSTGLLPSFFPPLWRMSAPQAAAHLARAFGALALLAAVWASGRALLARLLPAEDAQADDPWEREVFAFGLGFAMWSLAVLGLGLAGGLRGWLLRAAVGAGGAAAVWTAWRVVRGRAAGGVAPRWGADALVPGLLFLLLAATQLPYALAPETFYDALVYHLALPARYLREGAVAAQPNILFAGVPSAPQMLFTAALALEPMGLAAKLFHFGMLFWVAAALVAAARRLGRPEAAPLALCALFSAPFVLYECTWATVGLETVFFRLLCFLALLEAGRAPAGSSRRRRLMLLCGVFCGAAMSCKYTDWLLPGSVVLVVLCRRWHGEGRDLTVRDFVPAAAAALLILAPWAAKNLAHYGNPVHPFAAQLFAPAAAAQLDLANLASDTAAPEFHSWAGLLRYLRHPWDLSVHAGFVDMDAVGPVWLCVAALFALFPMAPPVRFALCAAVWSWLPLSLFALQARFFMPAFALLGLAGALQVWSRGGAQRSLLTAGFVVLACYSSLFILAHPTRRLAWPVILGEVAEAEFLAHGNNNYYPNPPFAAYRWVRDHQPPGAKVLVFGDARGFYLERDHIASTVFNADPLLQWANASADGEELKARIRGAGITHVVVNRAEILRLNKVYPFTQAGRRSLYGFWNKYTAKEFEVGANQDRWVIGYRLLDDAEAARPHPAYDLFREPVFAPGTEPKNEWLPPPGLPSSGAGRS